VSRERRLALVAGAATALSATSLVGIYATWNWMFYVVTAIAAVTGSAIGARALGWPRWTQPVAAVAGLFVWITVVFADGALLGVVPTPAAVRSLITQARAGFEDVAGLSAPVPDRRGLLLLTAVGVGLVAVVVDLIAVVLRRPALSGLALLALYAVPVAIDRQGLVVAAFAAGAAGYLWLLVTDHVADVVSWGRPFRPAVAPGAAGAGSVPGPNGWAAGRPAQPVPIAGGTPLGATGRRLGLLGILIAILAPLFVPGLAQADLAGIQERLGLADSSRSVQTINPITQLSGQLTQPSNTALLTVRTDEDAANYLRLTTLDSYTGTGWEQTRDRLKASAKDRVSELDPLPTDIDSTVAYTNHTAEIQVGGLDMRYLPVFPNPTAVRIDGDWRFHSDLDTVFSAKTTTRGRTYRVDYRTAQPTTAQLEAAPDVPRDSPLRPSFTDLTAGTPEPSVKAIFNGLVRNKQTQFEKVQAIRGFFRGNGFTYSLQTNPGTSEDALANFLNPQTGRAGYCEQYASAMAYLVRLAGIPTRVAIGFTGGTKQGGQRVISTRNAHAWVEVYYQGVGWVPYDPTPSTGPNSAVVGDTTDNPWEQPAVTAPGANPSASTSAAPGGASAAPQNDADARDQRAEQAASGPAGGARQSGWSRFTADPLSMLWQMRWWLLAGLLVLVLVAGPYVLRRLVRRRRLRATGTVAGGGLAAAAAAHAAWAELVDTMTDYGTPLDDAETPRTLAARLVRDLEFDERGRAAITVLARAEEEARYAPAGVTRADLTSATRAIVQQVNGSAERRARLRATLLPPSLLGLAAEKARWADDRMTGAVRRLAARLPRRRR
jgi:transglutaminase-like putative cysteine protease